LFLKQYNVAQAYKPEGNSKLWKRYSFTYHWV